MLGQGVRQGHVVHGVQYLERLSAPISPVEVMSTVNIGYWLSKAPVTGMWELYSTIICGKTKRQNLLPASLYLLYSSICNILREYLSSNPIQFILFLHLYTGMFMFSL